jgi:periplasmic protein TonB
MTSAAEIARGAWHRLLVALGALGLTLLLFLVLPLMKTIAKPPTSDLEYRSLDTAELEPPPPPPEEEPEDQPEPEEEPPELSEHAEPLDLSQLELALSPGLGDGWTTGDFEVGKLATASAASTQEESEGLFALADLDQKPRILYQPSPVLVASAR